MKTWVIVQTAHDIESGFSIIAVAMSRERADEHVAELNEVLARQKAYNELRLSLWRNRIGAYPANPQHSPAERASHWSQFVDQEFLRIDAWICHERPELPAASGNDHSGYHDIDKTYDIAEVDIIS